MKPQFTRKAKPEPTTTPTAIEPKTSTKLANPKPRSATVVVKRRGKNGPAVGHGGGNATGGNPRGGNSGGINLTRSNNTGKRSGSSSSNKNRDSCNFVPVRRKPLGDYLPLEETSSSSRPTTSSSYSSDNPPPMSYAAAVESHPVSRLKVKVVLSPRVKRVGNQPVVKRQSPKSSPVTKVKTNPPSPPPPQSKPHNVQESPKGSEVAPVAPQSQIVQENPATTNSTPLVGSAKPQSKKSKKAKKRQQRAKVESEALPVPEKPSTSLQSSSPTGSEIFAYLDHHHERMQRFLAEQTAGQGPYPNRGHVKSCKHTAQLPTHRSLFDFDERLFQRGDLEAAALLAQNKIMLQKWLEPSMLIS
ncbi:probable serine/threonine-protein kinase samkC [Drosophila biarmipes]|uniref:probable serine/threonine-protein kinase samkC n=1 Tax=Drosophila biarmipes TaxID=125945 RepID=UPI0007E792E3|nr:probable serine/threonine-protein kinase samkC [Drosophila biarmipes]